MNLKRTTILLATPIIAFTLITGAACGDDDEDVDDESTPTQSPRPEAEDFDLAAGDDLTFTPDAIELEVGESLDIQFTNEGATGHTFTLDELHIDIEVAAGEEETIPLTASAPGEYTFYCKFHDASGMVGTLRVGVPEGDEADATDPAGASPDAEPTEISY